MASGHEEDCVERYPGDPYGRYLAAGGHVSHVLRTPEKPKLESYMHVFDMSLLDDERLKRYKEKTKFLEKNIPRKAWMSELTYHDLIPQKKLFYAFTRAHMDDLKTRETFNYFCMAAEPGLQELLQSKSKDLTLADEIYERRIKLTKEFYESHKHKHTPWADIIFILHDLFPDIPDVYYLVLYVEVTGGSVRVDVWKRLYEEMCKVAETRQTLKPEIREVLDAYVRKHYKPEDVLGLEFNVGNTTRLMYEHLKEVSLDSVCRKRVLMSVDYDKERCMMVTYLKTQEDSNDKVVREQKEYALKNLLQHFFNSSELYNTPRCDLFTAVAKQ